MHDEERFIHIVIFRFYIISINLYQAIRFNLKLIKRIFESLIFIIDVNRTNRAYF